MAESESDQQELEIARRRIAQLEAALSQRSDLLEKRRVELEMLRNAPVFRAAVIVQKLIDKTFPRYSRRRIALKRCGTLLIQPLRWLWRIRKAKDGPPTEDRYREVVTPASEYRRWIRSAEPTSAQLAKQRNSAPATGPIISLVVPVFNPPLAFLRAMVESVQAQTYPHWQLCLADASTEPTIAPWLSSVARSDSRIVVHTLAGNHGITANSQAALDLATGDFVGFLDHDDMLAPFALHEVSRAIAQQPDADVIYSDEDKLDEQGQRIEPIFKPDWSPDTLRSRNYLCHFTVIRRSLLQSLSGFRAGFEGAQDYDLVLRATERARRIVHVPSILYHWRMHAGSTAARTESKTYAFEAGRKALEDHLRRTGLHGTVQHGPVLGTYRVTYALTRRPLVSVIIPSKDHADLLARSVNSLARGSYEPYEVLVVENGSVNPATFAYYDELRSQPNARVLTWDQPFNYAAVNNFAARQARGELLLFLNNDVDAINPDWLANLVRYAIQPGVGAVGAKLYYPDDTVQHAGVIVGMGGVAGHGHVNFPRDAGGYDHRLRYTQNLAAVTGACLMTPRAAFEQVGGFDEGYVLAFNDVDLCVKLLHAGLRIVWTPDAELYHYESKTRGPEDTVEKQLRFRREYDLFHAKWGEFLKAGDPFFSRHFRLDRVDVALKVA